MQAQKCYAIDPKFLCKSANPIETNPLHQAYIFSTLLETELSFLE